MKALFEAVRGSTRPGLWTKGVKLAREGRVALAERNDDEVELQVRDPGRPTALTVTLYLDDDEGTCDCDSAFDPCEHVAAAVIAMKQSGETPSGDDGAGDGPRAKLATVAETTATLSYRFRRDGVRLQLDRVLVHPGGREETLQGALSSLVARLGARAPVAPSQDDLLVDRILSSMRANDPLEPRMAKILSCLEGASDVRFEGRSVKPATAPVKPRGRLIREGKQIVLTIEAPPGLEVVGVGLGLQEGRLCALAEPELAGHRFERLPLRQTFEANQLAQLAAEVVPDLEKRVELDVRIRLPRRGGKVEARIDVTLEHGNDGRLGVFPLLVYGDPAVARVDGGRLVHLGGALPRRDEARERQLTDRLREEMNLVPGRRVWLAGSDAAKMIQRLEAFLGKQAQSVVERRPLEARVEIDGNDFSVAFEVPRDDDDDREPLRAEPGAVLRAFRQGLDVVALDGGGWAPLPADWLRRYGEQIADLLAAKGERDQLPTVALPLLGELCDALEAPTPPALDRLRPLFRDFQGLPEADLPEDLEATLRPYQLDGVRWLSFLRDAGLGAVLADDMGLGKTLQALTAVRGKTLVVCPKSVIFNWADEIAKFRPGLAVHTYHGPKRTLDDGADITLTTYSVLRLDIDELATAGWDTVVLDEAQAIKNPDSQVTRAAYRVEADFRVSLSGTPVENRLDELWSQLHFTNPGLLGGRGDFQRRYVVPIEGGDGTVAGRLARRIKPFVLRRLKRDVVPELPPRTDVVLHVELEPAERDAYDAVRAATRNEVAERLSQGGGVLAALEALLRLRQAACHRGLLPGQDVSAESSKVARLMLALEDAAGDGHKALVFSQWTSLLDRIEPSLKAQAIPFLRLDGSTRDRGAVVDAFQDPEGPPVLLLSLKAGGTGLNLTAADHVFLMDPWWNPAAEDQAADRAHRIGQDRPVLVHRLVAKDTVEERILALQKKKRALADAALAGTASAGISRDELLELLD